MKTYILGTGGVGGYFGAKLAVTGADVTFVARGDHAEAIKKDGLLVKTVDGNLEVKPAKVITSIDHITDPDLILYCVKTYDTHKVASELKKVVTPKTNIITFQNGVDNDLKIKNIIPNASVYPGVAYIISKKSSPGTISQTGGACKMVFGDRTGQNPPSLEVVYKLMLEANINCVLTDQINLELWRKYIFIVPFAGMTTHIGMPIGQIRDNPELYETYQSCLREIIQLASLEGVALPLDIYEQTLALTQKTAPDSKSSLLHDLENGRPTELETIIGTALELSHKHGLVVPTIEMLYHSIKSKIS